MPGNESRRIEQARFLKAEENGVGAEFGAEAAIAEFDFRFAGIFFEAGVADFGLLTAAAFKDSEHVAGLRDFPALDWFEVRQNPFLRDFFLSRWRRGDETLRLAVRAVALSKAGGFEGDRTVVIESGAPEHCAVGHHAGLHFADFGGVASGGATGFLGDTKIAWVHEADVIPVFLEPVGVGADWIGCFGVIRENFWLGMGLVFCGVVFSGVGLGGRADVGIAAVTVGAS